MRKIFAALILFAASILLAPSARAQSITPFLIENLLGGSHGPYNFGQTAQVCNVATVFGWNQIETADGTYNWADMDYAQTASEKQGCKWSPYLVAGWYTPTWLYTADTQSQYKSCDGTHSVPIPWNTTFQTKWEAFVNTFAQRYGSDKHIFTVGVIGINTNFPSIKFPAATTGGTCATTSDATDWGACVSGPDVSGMGCQGTGQSNYTIALVESTMTTLGNYMIQNILPQFQAYHVKMVIAPQAGASFPLVSGQGAASVQRAGLFTTAGSNWPGVSNSNPSKTIRFESDGLACTSPLISSCFVDTTVTGAMASNFVEGIFQESAPYGNSAAYCTGAGTPNFMCIGPSSGNAGFAVNQAYAAVDATLLAVAMELYHNDETFFLNGPSIGISGSGMF